MPWAGCAAPAACATPLACGAAGRAGAPAQCQGEIALTFEVVYGHAGSCRRRPATRCGQCGGPARSHRPRAAPRITPRVRQDTQSTSTISRRTPARNASRGLFEPGKRPIMRQFVAVVPWHNPPADNSAPARGWVTSSGHASDAEWWAMQDLGIAFQMARDESVAGLNGLRPALCTDWLMKRNCSLSPRRVGWFYLSIVCISFAIALLIAWWGYWLVLPFAGLDLIGLGIALLVYARHAVDYERVSLAGGKLVVETASAGKVSRQEFNPHWVRVESVNLPGAGRIALGRACRAGREVPGPERAPEVRAGTRDCPAPLRERPPDLGVGQI